jgi:hypothetical protein
MLLAADRTVMKYSVPIRAGLSDAFAREIVGHESAAVSRQNTHLSTDDLRNALQRLPDGTNIGSG